MKLLEGFTEIEADEKLKAKIQDKRLLEGDNLLVQEQNFGYNGLGHCRIIGNRNPDPVEHQKIMDDVAAILYEGRLRRLQKEAEQKNTGA